jgi:hypothetical protein
VNEFIIVPIHNKGDKTDYSNYHGMSLLSTSYTILSIILPSGIISVGFNVTDQLPIRSFAICQILKKKLEYNETVNQLFIDVKKAYDSIRT